MEAIYIIDACRTPVGKHAGVLASVRPDDLAAHVVGALLERNPQADRQRIEDVWWGAANQAGEDNRNVARMASLLAGLPVEVAGATVNRLCGSGLQAVLSAAQAMALGGGDLMIAGGSESMSRAPYAMLKADRPYSRSVAEVANTTLGWRFVNPRMEELYPPLSLGMTAERVAERFGVSREDQDRFALSSHQRATATTQEGRFKDEIVPIESGGGLVQVDEGFRADTTLEAIVALPPVFLEGGTVTAGNSSQMSDGAAGVLLATERAAGELDLLPVARVVAGAVAGLHPDYMGIGPVPATRKLLERSGTDLEEIELVELNEAFAAQALACIRELGLDEERVNVNGGAIALGHPLGATGARLLTTLVHEMRRRGAEKGLVTMCIGVGQGISMLVETF